MNGRTIYRNSRGLAGLGLPRKANRSYPDGPCCDDLNHTNKDSQTGQTVTQNTWTTPSPAAPTQKPSPTPPPGSGVQLHDRLEAYQAQPENASS